MSDKESGVELYSTLLERFLSVSASKIYNDLDLMKVGRGFDFFLYFNDSVVMLQ